jgi:murein hydrolase activator
VQGNDAFSRLRGKLAWPVSGQLLARFGEARAGGVRWDGVLVGTERGTPVKAIGEGRVVYADWLPGLGLLAIVDHGDGYLSLYGHNERLFKAAGEHVGAGDTLAAAGDSGGSSRPELYFEIRKGGKPVDPLPWFRSAGP